MKKAIFSLFILIVLVPGLFGNLAKPFGIPPVSGDLISGGTLSDSLKIERELLILDVSKPYGEGAPCSAEYTIANSGDQEVAIDLSFLTPDVSNISIMINNEKTTTESFEIPVRDIPWLREEEIPPQVEVYKAERFHIVFNPGETKIVKVLFSLKAGWHNTAFSHGKTAPESAHMLNMMLKEEKSVLWYLYDLFSASTFGSTDFDFELIIITPEDTEFHSDLALTERSSPDGKANIYTGEFTRLPAKLVDFKLAYKTHYNFLGLTLGGGCDFPFDGRGIHFAGRISLDIYLSNHQFSIGIDGDPWSGFLHGSAIYTMFPPGRIGYGYGYFFDIRGGGGLLYDFFDNKGMGFRISGGVRIGAAYELFYDFFPFAEDGKYYHELGIICVMGF